MNIKRNKVCAQLPHSPPDLENERKEKKKKKTFYFIGIWCEGEWLVVLSKKTNGHSFGYYPFLSFLCSSVLKNHFRYLISSQSLNLGGRRGTTDDVATIPFHPSLSSAALRESPTPLPVHSLMLSSHLFFCLPLLLAPFTVPCRIVFAMLEDLEMWPYHLSFRFFTMVRRSSCTPIAFWILLRTSSFVTWSL